jgi:hypothetical protein
MLLWIDNPPPDVQDIGPYSVHLDLSFWLRIV